MARKPKRRSHSREFKFEAVRRTHEPGKTIADVARELDLPENELHEWRTQVAQKGDSAFPGAGRRTPHSDVEQLRRENARLREECAILKKAAIYFAKESNGGTSS